ncbi:hypothetical protein [Massilia varians]|uniref:hypothetical protein n=1 Tax=Massilia varians TaxID=457921 RepID=UPI0025523478|nr:hypothetical protein [Massilia varians]MDK6079619.1 hypothetical protein [Massilia varians]
MRLWNLIRTASPTANWLAVLSLLLLVGKIFWLNRIPSTIDGVYEIGAIFEAILASVIASYVFYLIVVHIQEQSDRDALQPYIAKHAQRIVRECASQLSDIATKSHVPMNFETLTKASLSAAFSKLDPNGDSPLAASWAPTGGTYAPWLRYMEYHNERTAAAIQRLLAQLRFLDAGLVRLVVDVDDCSHFRVISLVSKQRLRNTDMSAFSDGFYEYYQSCQRLNEYLVANGMG